MLTARGSIATANSKGLRGQPCLQDRCNEKAGDLLLLVMTEAVRRAYSILTQETKLSPKPNSLIVVDRVSIILLP